MAEMMSLPPWWSDLPATAPDLVQFYADVNAYIQENDPDFDAAHAFWNLRHEWTVVRLNGIVEDIKVLTGVYLVLDNGDDQIEISIDPQWLKRLKVLLP